MLVGAMGVVRVVVGGERWCREGEECEVAGQVAVRLVREMTREFRLVTYTYESPV